MSAAPRKGTVLAFDFGLRRIGVAVGQWQTCTASPVTCLSAREGQPDWSAVQKLLDTWEPGCLVVGRPLNMDGSEQPITLAADKFARRLHGRFGLPVHRHDERLTSIEAEREMFQLLDTRQARRANLDARAACLILEGWFAESTDGAGPQP
jgi:putative Holliday junction resolvase